MNPEAQRQARQRRLEGRARAGRGRALLRALDARRGRAAHRPPLPQGQAAEGAGRRRGDRHRLAVGAHREVPNPACGAEMPLVRSFALSTKKGKEAWVEPIVDACRQDSALRGEDGDGEPRRRDGRTGKGRAASCAAAAVPLDHVRDEGRPVAWARS